jgi:molecular chaperone HtpG
MMEQQKLGGGGFYGAFPETYNLIVNANHEKVVGLLNKDEDEKSISIKQLTDLALLSQGMLKGEALSNFIERTIEQVG